MRAKELLEELYEGNLTPQKLKESAKLIREILQKPEPEWINSEDITRFFKAVDENIKAAFCNVGNHWCVVLKVNENYALLYDPLRGVLSVPTSQLSPRNIVFSPALENEFYNRRKEGLVIYTEEGTISVDNKEFLEYSGFSVSDEKINELERVGGVQNDEYNCGPLCLSVAYYLNARNDELEIYGEKLRNSNDTLEIYEKNIDGGLELY